METNIISAAVLKQYEDIKNTNLSYAIGWVLSDEKNSQEPSEKEIQEYVKSFDSCVNKLCAEIERHTTIPDQIQIQTKDEKVRITFFAEEFQIQVMFFMTSPFNVNTEWVLNYIEETQS